MLVQLSVLYTDPGSHSAQHYGLTDRQTDRWEDYANSRLLCVAVRSNAIKIIEIDIEMVIFHRDRIELWPFLFDFRRFSLRDSQQIM